MTAIGEGRRPFDHKELAGGYFTEATDEDALRRKCGYLLGSPTKYGSPPGRHPKRYETP